MIINARLKNSNMVYMKSNLRQKRTTSVRSSATIASHCACAAESGNERSKSIGVCAQCRTLTAGGECDRAFEHLSISRSIKLCFWSSKKPKEQCQSCTQPSSIGTRISFPIDQQRSLASTVAQARDS